MIVGFFLVFWTFVLRRTRFGRHIYAVGGNTEAARRAGISIDRIKIACFALCSFMAAVGGIVLASRLRSVDTNAGGGSILLYSIAAAVIGGTSLFGGRGHMKSAVLGALVIGSIDNGLGLLGLSSGDEVRRHRRRAAAGRGGRLALAEGPRVLRQSLTGVAAPVRWGILSTANINRKVLPGMRASEEVELVAVASRDGDRAAEYAREEGIPRAHAGYEALLADPDVEAVYISLPNAGHVPWSRRALEAGKHVLCEKPLTRRAVGGRRSSFDVAERAGRLLVEAFMWRHHPQTRRLVRAGARRRDRRAAAAARRVLVHRARSGRRAPAGRTSRAAR